MSFCVLVLYSAGAFTHLAFLHKLTEYKSYSTINIQHWPEQLQLIEAKVNMKEQCQAKTPKVFNKDQQKLSETETEQGNSLQS